jgi:hypothetical protein
MCNFKGDNSEYLRSLTGTNAGIRIKIEKN